MTVTRRLILVAIALALAWMKAVDAGGSSVVDIFTDTLIPGDQAVAGDDIVKQSGIYPEFPYCNCDRGSWPYALAPTVRRNGTSQFCFTIIVNTLNCNRPCCRANLYKIEFDVNPECKTPGASVTAHVNGMLTPFLPAYQWAPNGTSGTAVLRVNGLNLNVNNAHGLEVCLTLRPSASGAGCTTLQALCRPPAGSRSGVCKVALFDNTTTCCPTTETNVPRPPPSPRPPHPPPSPPPPCTQKLCAFLRVTKTPDVGGAFAFSNADCMNYQQQMATRLNTLLSAHGVLTSSFAGSSLDCSTTQISVCGHVSIPSHLNTTVNSQLQSDAEFFIDNTFKCSAVTGGYRFAYESDLGPCVRFEDQKDCFREGNVTFPFCNCTKAYGVPLAVDPVVKLGPSPPSGFDSHCFKIVSAPSVPLGTCNGGVLYKIEFWANDALRSHVRGFQIIQKDGSSTTRPATWAGLGSNTLKLTNINWRMLQANGTSVCIQLRKSVSLTSLCLAGTAEDTACYLSFFDASMACCTTFPVDGRGTPFLDG